MTIDVHSYFASDARMRVVISHAPHGNKPFAGMPGTRTTLLDETEARELHKQLTAALAAPTPCHDCGSDLHQTGSVFCREDRDCED